MIKYFSVLCFLLLLSFNTVNAQTFNTYKVKKGDTIEEIAKKYSVTLEQIYTLNPDAKKELKPNTILIIPRGSSEKSESENIKSTDTIKPKITIVKELQGYKEHKVKKRETLYSLGKRYNVTEDEIKKNNKFLYANNLRKGDRLQIPIFKITEIEEVVEKTKTYKVKAKEGKWRIAFKYGITTEELEALNPNMGPVLQEGQEIQVPNIEETAEKEIDNEKYSYYKVLKAEGFYRLKIKLGLEKEELEKLNPELKELGLKNGMILKVPFSEELNKVSENIILEKVNLAEKISNFDTKHIAIMLPFRLDRVDYETTQDTKKSIKGDPYLKASLDFYSGALLALDSLKELGVSVNVDVYDTKHQVSEVEKIMDENDFESLDAVIGPLTTKTFEKAALALRINNIPIVSPIGTDLKLYDNVFQARPSNNLLKDRIVKFVKSDSLVKNIIVVADKKNTPLAKNIKEEFSDAKLIFSRKNKEGKEVNYILVDDIKKVLKPGKNVVFLETNNIGFISNVTSVLASLNGGDDKKASDIILVTTNFNSAFEGDEVSSEHLSSLHFHFATASKSYEDNRAFIKRYKKIYNTSPNKRVVKGFDLTMDVILRLVTSENLYTSTSQYPFTEYIENKYTYKKKPIGGYYNDAVYLVKYDNLRILEVKE